MDTIKLKLKKEVVPNINLMSEIPQFLSSISFDGLAYNIPTIKGYLKNFKVKITPDSLIIGDASLTKFHLGNNISMMGRSETRKAIENVCDILHLPIEKSEVINFHFGKNIMLNYDANLYLPYFGNYNHFKRLEQPHGINYKQYNKEFIVYDKIRELKHFREVIPPMYQNRFVLRLESKYKRQICNQFNKPIITANLLYDEDFYTLVNDKWQQDYLGIDKIKNIKIDMQNIKTKREMSLLGVLSLVQLEGGKLTALQNLKERYSKNELTKKQHFDLKKLIEESTKMKLQTIESDLIIELNQKVKEAVKYYV